jgi:hypothetical protein
MWKLSTDFFKNKMNKQQELEVNKKQWKQLQFCDIKSFTFPILWWDLFWLLLLNLNVIIW